MGKFNVETLGIGNGLLNEMSQNLKEGFEVTLIPIDKIYENENNHYSIEDIDELAESIKEVGLKQNLDVIKGSNGNYKLLSGHRRFKALQLLSASDDKYKMIPCTITELSSVHMPIDDSKKEKYLITITNSTQRNMTDSDLFNQYNDLIDIYKEAEKNGYKISGRRRSLIAKDMNISSAQVGKMDYIKKNATPELIEEIQKDNISIYSANEIAHMKENEQAEAISKSKEKEKVKFIDTLTQETYNLSDLKIDNLITSISKLNNFYEQEKDYVTINKKDYAKLHDNYKKIIVALNNIGKILDY